MQSYILDIQATICQTNILSELKVIATAVSSLSSSSVTDVSMYMLYSNVPEQCLIFYLPAAASDNLDPICDSCLSNKCIIIAVLNQFSFFENPWRHRRVSETP